MEECGRVVGGDTDNNNNQHVLPEQGATVSLVHNDVEAHTWQCPPHQRPDCSADVSRVVEKVKRVSGHCCCCPLDLAKLSGQQGRHCMCGSLYAHHVHVPPLPQPLLGLQVQHHSLPTSWWGPQIHKPTAPVADSRLWLVQSDKHTRLL